jgi:periplasmic protein TonB
LIFEYICSMKSLSLILGLTLIIHFSYAQTPVAPEPEFNIPEPQKDIATIALEKTNTTVFVEQSASFPGGESAFYKFIGKTLKKPELSTLFGFKGRIIVGFSVDKRGAIKDIHAFSNSGLGYEEEVIAAISKSPYWKPAIQNGVTTEQVFTIPFAFDLPLNEIDMKALKSSNYNFSFKINDTIYDIKQAEKILGSTFSSTKIDYLKSFTEQPEENKKNKKYLIQIKD